MGHRGRTWVPIAWLGIALLTGCAAGPELQRYPRTQIDRPHTLPKGVAAWGIVAPFFFVKDDSGSRSMPPIPVPLFWKTSLSDTVTLNWLLIPMLVSVQLDYDEQHLLGLDAGIQGLGYASGDTGFTFTPMASLVYRRKLSRGLALEGSIGANVTFFTGGRSTAWEGGVAVGPRFQLTELFSARPFLGAWVTYASFEPLVAPASATTPPKRTVFRAPVGLNLSWSVARQWDLLLDYAFHAVGEINGLRAHVGSLSAVHYW